MSVYTYKRGAYVCVYMYIDMCVYDSIKVLVNKLESQQIKK